MKDDHTCYLCSGEALDNDIGVAFYRFFDIEKMKWCALPACSKCLVKLNGPVEPVRVKKKFL